MRTILVVAAWAVLLGASPAVAGTAERAGESDARKHVRIAFERRGRSVPLQDSALDKAALHLAAKAVSGSAKGVTTHTVITDAMSIGGASDPSPRVIVLRGNSVEELVKSFLGRTDLAGEAAHAFGIGIARPVEDGPVGLVAILAERKARLRFFNRERVPGASGELCGELMGALRQPELFVTPPVGKVEKTALKIKGTQQFCGPVTFPKAGRYIVEILARGDRGPEVAALFSVRVGPVADDDATSNEREPNTLRAAQSALLDRINALRAQNGASAVRIDERLNRVAQDHSDEMADQGYFAHVSPDGKSVGQRLRKAGYEFERAGENLGLAHGPLAAHEGIEQSPGHRKNLLDARYTHVGLGVTFRDTEAGPRAYVTQVFAIPLATSGNPLEDAYKASNQVREKLKVPPLERSAAIEKIARSFAKELFDAGDPTRQTQRDIHKEVFEVLPDSHSAAVDVFISDSPSLVPESKAMKDGRNRWLGVGLVKGNNPKYGAGKYWVVLIYAGGDDD